MPDFDSFFREHYEAVVRALAVATGERARSEDAAQEAFARALRAWRRVGTMDRPASWVYVVAVNVLRRTWRIDRSETASGPLPVAGPMLADHAGSVVTGVALERAILQLAPRQRLIVVLRYHADLRIRDIAEAVGCAPGTVKSTLHTALHHLRVELTEEATG